MRKLVPALLGVFVAVLVVVAVPDAGAAFDYGFAEFRATCGFSHRAHDDPIVFPRQRGMSHSHDFFGSEQTNANTTTRKLRRNPTTCVPRGDKSAYWVPTLYDDGQAVDVVEATFYYTTHDDWTGPRVQPYPRGLRVIAGDAKATGPYADARYKWSCLGSGVSSVDDFPQCPDGSNLELLLNFPECWDGLHKDSADHKSHMAYRVAGKCPKSHPVPFPRLQFKLRYDTDGGDGITLASMNPDGSHGTSAQAFTAHGDFWNAWNRKALEYRIMFCLVGSQLKCDERGMPI